MNFEKFTFQAIIFNLSISVKFVIFFKRKNLEFSYKFKF